MLAAGRSESVLRDLRDLDVVDPVLRDELLEMRRADQQERTGEGLPVGAKLSPIRVYARTDSLKEIIAEVGWPTVDLVGPSATSAAMPVHPDRPRRWWTRRVSTNCGRRWVWLRWTSITRSWR